MPAAILVALKFIFVALVYLLVWRVATAVAEHVGAKPWRVLGGPGTGLAVVRSDAQNGLEFDVRQPIVLGSGGEADIHIDDAYASDLHARLEPDGESLTLADLGSTSGTYVNGKRVTAVVVLSRGDSIQIGKTVLEVR
ncbi:FHA domain-containing protein [Candidatus Spongiisocius sp.]|uniref:FHA domain-containing protein n=1 Tax=Candidatus Spongiisocius sp. TaxID=3101273 RepID=UPI003B5A5952